MQGHTDPLHGQNIVLAGFMGTGKTTVGRLLATRLGRDFVDADDLIEAHAGKTIPEIFARHGEAGFRTIETKIVQTLAERSGLVIAGGGGMVLAGVNVDLLQQSGVIICLTAEPEQIYARLLQDNESIPRPLLSGPDPKARISELLAVRKERYAQFPQVATDSKSHIQVVDAICDLLADHV